MGIQAKIIKDSVSPAGKRIVTFILTYPRIILPEVLTHRDASRNTESSRAIPVKKRLEEVRTNPYYPNYWGKNQSGMQAREELTGVQLVTAKRIWGEIIEFVANKTEELIECGLHKQIANRPLEPYIYIDQVFTVTELSNLAHLRNHPDAQPDFQELAVAMIEAVKASTPVLRTGWHLPFVDDDELILLGNEEALQCSVARCARVSTLNHDGTKPVPAKDMGLFETLKTSGHWSPFEHQAFPMATSEGSSGNFKGWHQYRKCFDNERRVNYPGLGSM